MLAGRLPGPEAILRFNAAPVGGVPGAATEWELAHFLFALGACLGERARRQAAVVAACRTASSVVGRQLYPVAVYRAFQASESARVALREIESAAAFFEDSGTRAVADPIVFGDEFEAP